MENMEQKTIQIYNEKKKEERIYIFAWNIIRSGILTLKILTAFDGAPAVLPQSIAGLDIASVDVLNPGG